MGQATTVIAKASKKVVGLTIVVAILGALCGAGIWAWVEGRNAPQGQVTQSFTGTISKLTSDGRGICVTEDSSADQRCGAAYGWPMNKPLSEGQKVTVLVTQIPGSRSGELHELFVVVRGAISSLP